MEQRTLQLNLSLNYGPRSLRVPLAALLLLSVVGDLNSESVTLSTYYPAPSGVYTNMITTGNTFLARDGGAASRVGVGTTTPGAKLAVSGSMSVGAGYAATVPPADGLIVSGRVGVGVPVPLQEVDVQGSVRLRRTGCNQSNTNGGSCPGGTYITWGQGVYIDGWWSTGPTVTVVPSATVHEGISMSAPVYYCCPD